MSIKPSAVVGGTRCPSNKIRARSGPKLRRLSADTAVLAFGALSGALLLPNEPENIGSVERLSKTEVGLVMLSCSGLTTVTGVGASLPLVMMRDPVTVIVSTVSDAAVAPLLTFPGVCAWTAMALQMNAPATASAVLLNTVDLIDSPPKWHRLFRGNEATHNVGPFVHSILAMPSRAVQSLVSRYP